MAEIKDKTEINRIMAQLKEPRPCKVCGTVFRPQRWTTAVLCSTTCQQRSHRGGDFMYIGQLPTEVARKEARARHERIEALIKEVQAHRAAVRERRRQRKIDEGLSGDFMVTQFATESAFMKYPDRTQEQLIAAVLSDLGLSVADQRSLYVRIAAAALVRTREVGRHWVFEHPNDPKESLIRMVRVLGLGCDPAVAKIIVEKALRELRQSNSPTEDDE
jgi:hypothetical protein